MMRTSLLGLAFSLALSVGFSSVAGAQARTGNATGHPYDISGVYSRTIYGADNAKGINPRDPKLNPPPSPAPLKPGAAEIIAKRRAELGEDEVTCNPRGPFEAIVQTPGAAIELVQIPGRMFIFIDLAHTYRTVWMTDKHDIDHLVPSYMGHAIGRWEGDTLIVDTVNFNGLFDIMNGFIPSDKLHTVERLRRNGQNLEYNLTIEDPERLTAPWSVTRTYGLRADWKNDGEIYCVASNQKEFLDRVDAPSRAPSR
jgi:hypothetical protein